MLPPAALPGYATVVPQAVLVADAHNRCDWPSALGKARVVDFNTVLEDPGQVEMSLPGEALWPTQKRLALHQRARNVKAGRL